jgi:hypothetical protein
LVSNHNSHGDWIPSGLNTQRSISKNINDLVVNSKVTIGEQNPEQSHIALVKAKQRWQARCQRVMEAPRRIDNIIGLDLFKVDHIDLSASDLQKFAPHLKKIAAVVFHYTVFWRFALGKFFMGGNDPGLPGSCTDKKSPNGLCPVL